MYLVVTSLRMACLKLDIASSAAGEAGGGIKLILYECSTGVFDSLS